MKVSGAPKARGGRRVNQQQPQAGVEGSVGQEPAGSPTGLEGGQSCEASWLGKDSVQLSGQQQGQTVHLGPSRGWSACGHPGKRLEGGSLGEAVAGA